MGHLVAMDGKSKTLMWVCGHYVYASIALPAAARVLEIGGGQDPHPAADVIVEKYMDDNFHRMMGLDPILGGQIRMTGEDGRELPSAPWQPRIVQADVTDMPFPNKSFDFVIAKDVLEHVPDIEQAFQEISRVGKAGMIDVPRMQSEWLWPQVGRHVWTFRQDAGGTLVAHRIRFTSPFGEIMHGIFAERGDVQDAWAQSRHYFHAVQFWQDEARVRIGEDAVGWPVEAKIVMREAA